MIIICDVPQREDPHFRSQFRRYTNFCGQRSKESILRFRWKIILQPMLYSETLDVRPGNRIILYLNIKFITYAYDTLQIYMRFSQKAGFRSSEFKTPGNSFSNLDGPFWA